jgi:hypothetical protein
MTPPPPEPRKQPTTAETPSSNTLKFSKMQVALAFVIAGISDKGTLSSRPLARRAGAGQIAQAGEGCL